MDNIEKIACFCCGKPATRWCRNPDGVGCDHLVCDDCVHIWTGFGEEDFHIPRHLVVSNPFSENEDERKRAVALTRAAQVQWIRPLLSEFTYQGGYIDFDDPRNWADGKVPPPNADFVCVSDIVLPCNWQWSGKIYALSGTIHLPAARIKIEFGFAPYDEIRYVSGTEIGEWRGCICHGKNPERSIQNENTTDDSQPEPGNQNPAGQG